MLLLLCLVFILINFISISGEDGICIWNIIYDGTGNSYTRLNGLYEYKKELYTKPFYANNNTACGDAVFLYYKINRWYLGIYPDPDPYTISGYSGRCQQKTPTSKDPTGCGSKWAVPYINNITLDANIAAINEKCPAWNDECTTIKIEINPSTTDECDGTFIYDATSGYDNVYSKYIDESTTMYWYFNFHAFQWVCSTIVNFDECNPTTSSQESFAGDYWQNINVDGTISMNLVSTKTMTVSCLTTAKPTPSPTRNPLAPPDDSSSNIIHLNLDIVAIIVFLWSLL